MDAFSNTATTYTYRGDCRGKCSLSVSCTLMLGGKKMVKKFNPMRYISLRSGTHVLAIQAVILIVSTHTLEIRNYTTKKLRSR